MGENKIAVKVRIEPADIIHFQEIILKTKTKIFNFRWVFILLISLISIIMALYNNADSSTAVRETVKENVEFPGQAIFFIVLFIIYITAPFLTKKGALKQYKNNKKLHGEIEYVFADDGLSGHSEYDESRYLWEHFSNAVETNYAFVLFISNNVGIIFPKRYFLNMDDIEAVRKLLKENMPGKKYQTVKIRSKKV